MATDFGLFVQRPSQLGLPGDAFKLAVCQAAGVTVTRIPFAVGSDLNRLTSSPLRGQVGIHLTFVSGLSSGTKMRLPQGTTELTTWRTALENAVDALGADLYCVSIENEFGNYAFYDIPDANAYALQYIAMLEILADVCTTRGILGVDGAAHGNALVFGYTAGMPTLQRTTLRNRYGVAGGAQMAQSFAIIQQVWQAEHSINVTPAFHYYQQTNEASELGSIIDWVRGQTNKTNILTNETGCRACAGTQALANMAAVYVQKNIPTAIFYASMGAAGQSLPLHSDTDGTLTAYGTAIKNFILSLQV